MKSFFSWMGKKAISATISAIFFVLAILWIVYALNYPSAPPVGEVAGGKFAQFFGNMTKTACFSWWIAAISSTWVVTCAPIISIPWKPLIYQYPWYVTDLPAFTPTWHVSLLIGHINGSLGVNIIGDPANYYWGAWACVNSIWTPVTDTNGLQYFWYASTPWPTQDCPNNSIKDYCWIFDSGRNLWADGTKTVLTQWMCREQLFGLDFTNYGTGMADIASYPFSWQWFSLQRTPTNNWDGWVCERADNCPLWNIQKVRRITKTWTGTLM